MILLIAFALVAPVAPSRDPQHGSSTRANFAAMIVPPVHRDPAVLEGGDGIVNVEAVRRYHTDKVKKPARTGGVLLGSGVVQ